MNNNLAEQPGYIASEAPVVPENEMGIAIEKKSEIPVQSTNIEVEKDISQESSTIVLSENMDSVDLKNTSSSLNLSPASLADPKEIAKLIELCERGKLDSELCKLSSALWEGEVVNA